MRNEKGVHYTNRVRFQLKIDEGLLNEIRQLQREKHTTLANVFEELLNQALKVANQ